MAVFNLRISRPIVENVVHTTILGNFEPLLDVLIWREHISFIVDAKVPTNTLLGELKALERVTALASVLVVTIEEPFAIITLMLGL